MILLAVKLILSHILGDFLFQPSSWVKDKEAKAQKSPYLYLHIIIHLVLLLILLQLNLNYWVGILGIVISHFGIDLLKIKLKNLINSRILFFADQILHLLVIAVVVNYYEPYNIAIEVLYSVTFLVFIIFVLLITLVSSVIMKILISKWNIKSYSDPNDSLKDAGAYIGMLERLFVFIFILTDHWEGVGFLITAKSVFRYNDLSKAKDRSLTEYILIGTLLSFGLAIALGISYEYLIPIMN